MEINSSFINFFETASMAASFASSFATSFAAVAGEPAHFEKISFLDNYPIFPIIFGLMFAPALIIFKKPLMPYLLSVLSSFLVFLSSLYILYQVTNFGTINYYVGGWAPPIGINLYIDLVAAVILTLLSFVSFLAVVFSILLAKREVGENKVPLFYSLMMLFISGTLGVVMTGDAFNIFVFLEISSLSTYALIALNSKNERKSLTASFNYLILGTLGATFYLIGVGLLYQATGHLNLAFIADSIIGLNSNSFQLGIIFVLVGLSLKAALFPLHNWLPGAYSYAPSTVTVLLSATSTKMAVYIFIKYIFQIFGADNNVVLAFLSYIVLPLSLIGMIITSLIACFLNDIKKILAYSSIGQIAYILVGLTFLNVTGLEASFMHIIFHSIIKAGLFMGVAIVIWRFGNSYIQNFSGLFYNMPFVSSLIILLFIALIGLPPSIGFATKWYLLNASIESENYLALIVISISSLISVVYCGRIIKLMIFGTRFVPNDKNLVIDPASPSEKKKLFIAYIPMIVLVFLSYIFLFGNFDFVTIFTDMAMLIQTKLTVY